MAALEDANEPFTRITVGASAIPITATYVTDTRAAAPVNHVFTGRYDDNSNEQANWAAGSVRAVPRTGDDVEIGDDATDTQMVTITAAADWNDLQLAEAIDTGGTRIVLDANFETSATGINVGCMIGKDAEGHCVQLFGTSTHADLTIGGQWNTTRGLYYLRGGTLAVVDLWIGNTEGVADENESNCALIQYAGTITVTGVSVMDSQISHLPSAVELRAGVADFQDLVTITNCILRVDSGMTSVDFEEMSFEAASTLKVTGAAVQQINASAAVTFASGATVDLSECTAGAGTYTLINGLVSMTDNGLAVVGTGWSHAVVGSDLEVTRA